MPELITLRDEDLKGDEPQVYFDELPLLDELTFQTLQQQMNLDALMRAAQQQQYLPLQGQIFITLSGIGQTYTMQQNIGNPFGGLFGGLTGVTGLLK